jgi:hypothetical protein
MKTETRYRRFAACSRGSHKHQLCTGAYLTTTEDELEKREVRFVCSCEGHLTGACGSAQTNLFTAGDVAASIPTAPQQGKLF